MFSNLLLSLADRKLYCNSDDPPWHIQKYPKLCVFSAGILTTISLSKLTWNYIYLYNAWLSAFSNIHHNEDDTYWELLFKVSTQRLPIDGVSLVMNCVPWIDIICIRQLVLSSNSKQVIPQFLSTDGMSDIVKYSKCNNIA